MVSDGTYLYAATFDGVFRTTNPASGWELVASGDESRYHQNIYVIDGEIYTGADGGAKAHRLENGSETWSLVTDDPDAFMNHFTKVGDTYFATDLSSDDLRSSTDGESWEFVELENFPLGGYIFGVGNRLFAHTSPSGALYKSDDLQSFSVLLDDFVGMVAVSGNTIFAQRPASLAVSTDAGDTWTEFTNHPAFDLTGAALTDAIVYNGMWVVGSNSPYQGLLISPDQGGTWEFTAMGTNFGMPLKDFTVHNGVLYGSTPFGTVSRIDFDGSTPSFTEEGNGLRSSGVLDFGVAGDKLFAHRFNGSRYTINGDLSTSPGFEEWTGVDQPANSGLQLNKNFRDGVFVVFTSPEDAIYMRRHNDNSFTNITGNLTELLGPNWFVFAALMADDVICMHMGSGNFVTSSDGGATWVDRGVVPYSLRPEVLYHNGSIIAFSGLGPHAVYRSNDLGET